MPQLSHVGMGDLLPPAVGDSDTYEATRPWSPGWLQGEAGMESLVGPSETQWDLVAPGGTQWDLVGPSETQQDLVTPNGIWWALAALCRGRVARHNTTALLLSRRRSPFPSAERLCFAFVMERAPLPKSRS